MRVKWLLAVLILIVFISGCVEQGGDGVTPVYNDNALNMEVKIQEKIEKRRILPGSTIRMVVTLTNQVENATDGVDLKITNPYGIQISKVDCGSGCVCEWPNDVEKSCTFGKCYYNGCYYNSIQSLDKEEITFGLKIPTEEQISEMGRDLQPKIVLKYNYNGVSALYIPIYKYGEQPTEPKKEATQTTGPIKVDMSSDNWVRAGDLFPIYLTVKDVVNPSKKLTINKDDFTMTIDHASISESTIGRCDFEKTTVVETVTTIPIIDCHSKSESECVDPCFPCEDRSTGEFVECCKKGEACHAAGFCEQKVITTSYSYYIPEENITLPLKNPIVCTLKAEEPQAPMIKAPIIIGYSYTYEVERTETIRVEKAFLGIF